MKSTTKKRAKNILKSALLLLPLLLLTFCQNIEDDIIFSEQAKLTKDSKVVSLMIDAIKSNNDKSFAKSDDDEQCTHFSYPLTLDVFFGDNPTPTVTTFTSDEELLAFLYTLAPNTSFYIYFPITLLDGGGNPTTIETLDDFVGTLEMVVDACQGNDDNDDSDDDNYCHSNNKKVYICHKGITICVSINAIWGHLHQHEEDFLGKCE